MPSHPSPVDMSDEAKAARVREYEGLSALARKKSKDAAKITLTEAEAEKGIRKGKIKCM